MLVGSHSARIYAFLKRVATDHLISNENFAVDDSVEHNRYENQPRRIYGPPTFEGEPEQDRPILRETMRTHMTRQSFGITFNMDTHGGQRLGAVLYLSLFYDDNGIDTQNGLMVRLTAIGNSDAFFDLNNQLLWLNDGNDAGSSSSSRRGRNSLHRLEAGFIYFLEHALLGRHNNMAMDRARMQLEWDRVFNEYLSQLFDPAGGRMGALAMATHSRLGAGVPDGLAEALFHSGLLENMEEFRGLNEPYLSEANSGPYAALLEEALRRRAAGLPWMLPRLGDMRNP